METIKWCYCVQGKGNGTLNNELVKAVGKSLMQGVGLNLVLTLSLCKLFPGDKKQGRGTILRANIIPFPPTTHISHSLLILLIYKSPWWRCGGISSCFLPFLLSIILNSRRLHFPLHSQAGFPHLLSLYILDPPTTTLPTPSSHLPSPLPAISLLARPAADWLFPARAQ